MIEHFPLNCLEVEEGLPIFIGSPSSILHVGVGGDKLTF